MRNPYEVTAEHEEFYGEVAGYRAFMTIWSDHNYTIRLTTGQTWTWDDITLDKTWEETPTEEEIQEELESHPSQL